MVQRDPVVPDVDSSVVQPSDLADDGSPLSGASRRRGRPRSVATQVAILNATIELLEKQSLRDVTADAIAQRAGVSKATIYKWWPNKTLVALDAFLARAESAVAVPDTGCTREDVERQLKAVIAFYTNSQGRLIREFIAAGQTDPDLLVMFRQRFLTYRRETVRIIWERGVERGDIRGDLDCELVIDLIYGPVFWRLLAGHCLLDDRQAEAIVAAVFGGIHNVSETSLAHSIG
ncbi:MAG TPA: TetR/AcrR family transcriptional regulator [Pirellulales bacterium]|jgi:AcrR family transcriptional regulator|nr:TetR/AcrR family transcriptional regulator [Pirellulales bacterium]